MCGHISIQAGELMEANEFKNAMLEPAAVFRSPAGVLRARGLTRDQRIEILQSWEYQAADETVSLEEGKHGEDSDLLWQVLDALGQLTGRLDLERTASTKQHGLSLDAIKKAK
jgi:hypothetical protein